MPHHQCGILTPHRYRKELGDGMSSEGEILHPPPAPCNGIIYLEKGEALPSHPDAPGETSASL